MIMKLSKSVIVAKIICILNAQIIFFIVLGVAMRQRLESVKIYSIIQVSSHYILSLMTSVVAQKTLPAYTRYKTISFKL